MEGEDGCHCALITTASSTGPVTCNRHNVKASEPSSQRLQLEFCFELSGRSHTGSFHRSEEADTSMSSTFWRRVDMASHAPNASTCNHPSANIRALKIEQLRHLTGWGARSAQRERTMITTMVQSDGE
jgi:hypothetical protein